MSEPRSQNISSIMEAIHRHERFLVATHARPDGDAIGSLLALTFILRKLGKSVTTLCQDPPPPGLEFLPGIELIHTGRPESSPHDAAILVDCGDLKRVGPLLEGPVREVGRLINIDHHVSNGTPYGDLYWVQPSASSTCEMLYDLSRHLGLSLDPDIATQLYTGILTDTGSFMFSNTNRRVLEIAAELVAAGARPASIAEHVYDSASPQRLRLLCRVLETVAFFADERLATAELTRSMLQDTSTSAVDAEGFINHLRSVRTVRMAILFREEKDGVVHVSMRSKGEVDVASLAQKHGGGGHRHAAAFRVSSNIDELRRQFTGEAVSYLQ